jgi:probable rRNA maturation factor
VFVAQASRAAGLKGSVTVMVTHSRQMRALNARFRGKKQATDVLSFPPPALGNGFAGDIAVSLDIAARNARSLGHSLGKEVQILVLHGILHLAGYDHEDDEGEMAEREVRLRRRLGLPTGLIERSEKNRLIARSGHRVI